MNKLLLVVVLFMASSGGWCQDNSTSVTDSSLTEASTAADVPTESKSVASTASDAGSTWQVNTEDPALSFVCQKCHCGSAEVSPLAINCSSRDLGEMFLDSDWPSNSLLAGLMVDFSGNQLTSINAPFPSLKIISLTFENNGIRAIEPKAFQKLQLLESLNLKANGLTHESLFREVFTGVFSGLNDGEYEPIPLRELYLGYNQIHSISQDTFDHTPNLQLLELNNNPLAVIDRQTEMAITSLSKLQTLNLAETGLESIPEGFLHTMRSLRILILSGNQLTTVPSELRRSPNLQVLNLNNNPISKMEASSFVGLTSLVHLEISSMQTLRSIGERTFSPLKSLRALWCSNNGNLTSVHPKAFLDISNDPSDFVFTELHMRGNRLAFVSKNLLPWDKLDVIDVEENPFVCDCRVGWMVTNLVPTITDKSPELTLDLVCSAPEKYRGRSLASLDEESDIVDCSYPGDDDVTDDVIDGTGRPDRRPSHSSGSSMSLMIISLFGILMVIGGLGLMALMTVRKRHLRQMYDQASGQIIHYVRTANPKNQRDDEEAIIENNQSPFDEEPM